MDLLTIYLLTVLPNLGILLGVLSSISLVCTLIFLVITSINRCNVYSWTTAEEKKEYVALFKCAVKTTKFVLPISFLLLIVCNLIPNERQMYTIIGGYAVTNIEGIDKLPKNLIGAANKFIENYAEPKEKVHE